MKKIIFAALFFSLTASLYAQCSDAGVCILGKKHQTDSKKTINTVSLGYRFGTSGKDPDISAIPNDFGFNNDLIFNSVYLDADLAVSPKSRLGLSIPYTVTEGPLGHNNGLGDLSVLYSYSFVIKKKHNLTISVGGKASIASVNTSDSLPQRYMPGLGTNDLIAGATYSIDGYSLSLAYQKPFGRSANFISRLKRGDDFLFRTGYTQQFNKLFVKAEILTILRIQKSNVLSSVDSNGTESYVDIEGSNEPQVNLLASVGFMASKNIQITIDAAIPFLNRDYNIDGLKRSFTAGASVGYLF